MPTVIHDIRGYRVFFFSLDRGEPVHVHVAKGRAHAKYWMQPLELARSRNFRAYELNEIAQILENNRAIIERKWHEHFGRES
ncbi:MAG: DUF4160 domain-containing protein [Candidatus Hydrogenedentes bacterium]|nr:DUF4160 domain-containing protein [Candidatus Hydrogenedentota bacterium]